MSSIDHALRAYEGSALSLNDYQERAAETAIYPHKGEFKGLAYTVLKLAGEAGEVAEKLGKNIRDHNGEQDEQFRQEMKKEIGDVLWYVAAIAGELGFTLEEIAHANLVKLASRKERGVLGGSGDNR